MTWQEYYNELIESGCNDHNADNIIGHLMDLYESWDWDAEMPFNPHERRE